MPTDEELYGKQSRDEPELDSSQFKMDELNRNVSELTETIKEMVKQNKELKQERLMDRAKEVSGFVGRHAGIIGTGAYGLASAQRENNIMMNDPNFMAGPLHHNTPILIKNSMDALKYSFYGPNSMVNRDQINSTNWLYAEEYNRDLQGQAIQKTGLNLIRAASLGLNYIPHVGMPLAFTAGKFISEAGDQAARRGKIDNDLLANSWKHIYGENASSLTREGLGRMDRDEIGDWVSKEGLIDKMYNRDSITSGISASMKDDLYSDVKTVDEFKERMTKLVGAAKKISSALSLSIEESMNEIKKMQLLGASSSDYASLSLDLESARKALGLDRQQALGVIGNVAGDMKRETDSNYFGARIGINAIGMTGAALNNQGGNLSDEVRREQELNKGSYARELGIATDDYMKNGKVLNYLYKEDESGNLVLNHGHVKKFLSGTMEMGDIMAEADSNPDKFYKVEGQKNKLNIEIANNKELMQQMMIYGVGFERDKMFGSKEEFEKANREGTSVGMLMNMNGYSTAKANLKNEFYSYSKEDWESVFQNQEATKLFDQTMNDFMRKKTFGTRMAIGHHWYDNLMDKINPLKDHVDQKNLRQEEKHLKYINKYGIDNIFMDGVYGSEEEQVKEIEARNKLKNAFDDTMNAEEDEAISIAIKDNNSFGYVHSSANYAARRREIIEKFDSFTGNELNDRKTYESFIKTIKHDGFGSSMKRQVFFQNLGELSAKDVLTVNDYIDGDEKKSDEIRAFSKRYQQLTEEEKRMVAEGKIVSKNFNKYKDILSNEELLEGVIGINDYYSKYGNASRSFLGDDESGEAFLLNKGGAISIAAVKGAHQKVGEFKATDLISKFVTDTNGNSIFYNKEGEIKEGFSKGATEAFSKTLFNLSLNNDLTREGLAEAFKGVSAKETIDALKTLFPGKEKEMMEAGLYEKVAGRKEVVGPEPGKNELEDMQWLSDARMLKNSVFSFSNDSEPSTFKIDFKEIQNYLDDKNIVDSSSAYTALRNLGNTKAAQEFLSHGKSKAFSELGLDRITGLLEQMVDNTSGEKDKQKDASSVKFEFTSAFAPKSVTGEQLINAKEIN